MIIHKDNNQQIFLITLSYLIIILAYSFNQGFFSMGGLLLLSLALFLIILLNFVKPKFAFLTLDNGAVVWFLAFVFLVSLGLVNIIIEDDMNGFLSLAMFLERFFLLLVFILSSTYFFSLRKSGSWQQLIKWRFWLIFIFAFLIRLALLRVHKVPQVDVFYLMKYGPLSLLKGINPYVNPYSMSEIKNSWQEPYEVYVYGPASLFWFLPFSYFLADPRWLIILAELLTALLIRHFLKNLKKDLSILKELLPLVFLFNPLFFRMLIGAHMESLLLMLFFLGLLSFYSKRFWWLAYFWFGTAVAMKWTYGVGLFFIKHKAKGRYLIGGLVFLLTILLYYFPFLKTNHLALYKSLVLHEISMELDWLLKASLTWQTFFFRQFHFLPPLLIWVLPILLIFLILRWKTKNNPISLSLNMAGSVLAFYLFSPQGLFNYYMFVSFLLLLGVIFILKAKKVNL